MKPAEHHHVGLEALDDGRASAASQPSRVSKSDTDRDEGRDAGPLGARQALDAVPVGTDGDHAGAVRRIGAGVEQRLEVGAGPGDEDDEACGAVHER